MHQFISRGLLTVLFTGGLMAAGIGAANAADNTTGDNGTGSGSQAIIGIKLPITIGGNGISVLGDSSSNGGSTTAPATPAAPSGSTNGSVSLLGGTQALIDANAPVTVGGNAISVLGDSSSTGSSTGSDGTPGPIFTGDEGDGASTSGTDSTLGGTQVLGDVNAPVTVGGNAISVVGDSTSNGSTAGRGFSGESGGGAPTTSGDSGIASGTQVVPDVAAPVLASGNAVSVLGDSSSSGSSASNGGSTGGSGSGSAPTTSGSRSVLGGTQVAPDATAPVTASGNAVSVAGDSTSTGSTGAGSTAGGTSGTGTSTTGAAPTTSGSDSTLGGTQVVPDVTAPVTATGDAISVIGDSSSTGATGNGGGSVGGVDTTADGPSTSGDNSTGGGSQIAPVIRIPATVGRNAVSVVGDSSTTTDPGQPGQVGGVETYPPTGQTPGAPGAISAAALSEQSLLASTGVTVLPALILGLALLLLGAVARVRAVAVRR